MLSKINNLNELWKEVDRINKTNFPNNNLMSIFGNGKLENPKIMFVFINPTSKNISSSPSWKGPRFPFIGTKQIWRIFHKAGMFDDKLLSYIENNKDWSLDFTNNVLDYLINNSYYITNIVKWTGHDATLPNSEKIKLFLPTLEKEIEIVKPKFIVTFGLIPFENLTKTKIRLFDYYSKMMKDKKIHYFERKFGYHNTKIIPCYFPVGRGDPKKAIDILRLIK